jgi:hypothetical protein
VDISKGYESSFDLHGCCDQASVRVLGLTERLRDIGGSGVSLEAGLVHYRGRFVCNGVLNTTLWLGPSYKRSFNAAFAEMKAEGGFYVKCDANRVSHISD